MKYEYFLFMKFSEELAAVTWKKLFFVDLGQAQKDNMFIQLNIYKLYKCTNLTL